MNRKVIEAALGIAEYPEILTLPKIQAWKAQLKKIWYEQSKLAGRAYVPLHDQCTLCFKKFTVNRQKEESFLRRLLNSVVCGTAPEISGRYWCFFC